MQLTIEKLVYGGNGLAHQPAGDSAPGKAVFLPFVLPGEQVEAQITDEKKSFVRAWPEAVLQPSSERIEAHCPYFRQCGGCHYQHAGYEYQLQIKTAILTETLQRIGHFAPPPIRTHPSEPWHYRNRTRMKVRGGADLSSQQANDGPAGDAGFALGYFRFGSHELLPVEHCPISSPLINRTIGAVWELGRARLANQAMAEIEFFANAADNQILLEITLPDQYWTFPRKPSLLNFVTALRQLVPEIGGVVVFRATPGGAPIREALPEKTKSLFGAEELIYEISGGKYRVSAGSFFQTNRYLMSTLIAAVTAGHSGKAALDLYAGTGLFTLPLAEAFEEVTAVEAGSSPFYDLQRNSPRNVKASCESAEDFLGQHRNARFDLVVVDPPRAGLGEKTAAQLGELHTPKLNYVSCDPATLARDLKVLLATGFRIEKMDLLDLFPQTFHIETVTQLVR